MKKIVLILFIMPGLLIEAGAQKILTLKECYDKAASSSNLSGEKIAYTEIWQLKDRNLSKGWLPAIDANGSFIYNSSVMDIGSALGSIPIPGIADAISPLPHEQYKVTIDINQVIYDGGSIKNLRELEKAELGANEKQTETELYKLRGQINTFYFNILLLDRQKELLSGYLDLLKKRIASMQSAADNGVILRTDIDVMTSERIRLEQQINENVIKRNSFLKLLSGLTGTELNDSTILSLPASTQDLSGELSRPEIELFDLKKEQLAAGLKLIESKRLPRAFGFATLGYGNPPGSNFFKDEFAPYYILGAGIKWNIFDWNKVKNEKQIISLQQNIIENRKTDMTDNLARLLETKNAEIGSLRSLLLTDSELISIRKRITLSAGSQYENGVLTATELLNEINSEKQAMINYELHKINLSMAQVEYLNISGKEIE